MRGRIVTTTLVALLAGALLCGPAGAAGPSRQLRLGSQVLHRCTGGWCGSLSRPLDPARPGGPHISIAFKWLRAPGGGAGRPPLVAVEGGPGYPSIGSEVEYRGIYGPLLRERNLLLVDNRGTGASALIDCKRLQGYAGVTSGPAFPKVVAGCARQLDRRYTVAGRSIHAADLFGTAYATADLAAVIGALGLAKVDLYGDSYGTWFVQSFISRHQDLLHSVILDSSYPVRDLDPWYGSSGVVSHSAMDAVCARDAGCAAAAPSGTPTERLAQLLARLRARPINGATLDADGTKIRASVTTRTVVDLVQDAGSDPLIYRELDASVRAALAGDSTPLLRLVGQSRTWNHGGSTADYFTDGLYMAVACTDYPQLFAMSATPAQRRAQLRARMATAPVADFAPFTLSEWLTVGAYTQPYAPCLDWPRPVHRAPVVPAQPTALPASVPILMLGGDLDSLTPLADAFAFGPKLGANVRIVTLPNTVHVTSEGDTFLVAGAACARTIIRAFVRAPQALASLDTTCTSGIPPLHTPGAYPIQFSGAAAATLVSGPDPGIAARRAATVAAGALADATMRSYYSGVAHGPGLRGGRFTTTGAAALRYRLRAVRFVQDATVEGRGTWTRASGAVRGTLTVRRAGGAPVKVSVDWTQKRTIAHATVGGATLSLPAP